MDIFFSITLGQDAPNVRNMPEVEEVSSGDVFHVMDEKDISTKDNAVVAHRRVRGQRSVT